MSVKKLFVCLLLCCGCARVPTEYAESRKVVEEQLPRIKSTMEFVDKKYDNLEIGEPIKYIYLRLDYLKENTYNGNIDVFRSIPLRYKFVYPLYSEGKFVYTADLVKSKEEWRVIEFGGSSRMRPIVALRDKEKPKSHFICDVPALGELFLVIDKDYHPFWTSEFGETKGYHEVGKKMTEKDVVEKLQKLARAYKGN
jgi:hypothetical protein